MLTPTQSQASRISPAVSCHYVPEPRRRRYMDAVRRYCDWAAQWQLPSGGFTTNTLVSEPPTTRIYSIATGTQAAAFAAFYAVSGEPKFLQMAKHAATFLLDHWMPDGRPICFPHVPSRNGKQYPQPVTQVGDIFYYHDGILFVYHQTRDVAFREKVEKVYGWHIMGSQGLLRSLGDKPFLPLQDAWDNPKAAGMPLVFLTYERVSKAPAVNRAIGLAQRFLCTPKYAEQLGIMVETPDLPWGGRSLQSWACYSVAATGFGGITLAEMIQPGINFLS